MTVSISAARIEDQPRLRAMLSDYLAELSAYAEMHDDYPYFDDYWREPGARWPYLILDGAETIGFAFVRAIPEDGLVASMAEFYVLPAARGGGRGQAAVAALLQAHPGAWRLTILARNAPAQAYWPKAIAAGGGRDPRRSEDEAGDTVYHFSAPRLPSPLAQGEKGSNPRRPR
jgi:predicted acetyltransferase